MRTSSSCRCCSMCWSILALVTRKADFLFVVMSWMFVLTRLFHAYRPHRLELVRIRGGAFAVGAIILFVMWIIYAARILCRLAGLMTPAARLSAAIEVLADIEARRRPGRARR